LFHTSSERGLTPTIPNHCPPLLRQLMEMCWNKIPENRPVCISYLFFYLLIDWTSPLSLSTTKWMNEMVCLTSLTHSVLFVDRVLSKFVPCFKWDSDNIL
jgi:hypothetical protein